MPTTLGFREGLEAITKLALELADQISTPIILIDGRAGSGKSTFATQLRDTIFNSGEPAPTIVAMDDLYPGWLGLKDGNVYLEQNILSKLSSGKPATWQRWNWELNQRSDPSEPGNGWREFSGGNVLVIEGCASISRKTAAYANVTCWIDTPQETRRRRLEIRDGSRFSEYWPHWEVQHDEFLHDWNALSSADYVITS